MSILDKHPILAVRHANEKIVESTKESIDEFMSDYQTAATRQTHNVIEWCEAPGRINKIQGNLAHLKDYLRESDSLLDVGCYAGYVYDFLKHKNYSGMDYYQEMIDAARDLHPGVNFFQGSVYDYEFPADVVWCSRVLVHLPYFDKAVGNLIKNTSKKIFLVIDLSHEDIVHKYKEADGSIFYHRYMSEKTVRDAVEGHGAVVEAIKHGGRYQTVIIKP